MPEHEALSVGAAEAAERAARLESAGQDGGIGAVLPEFDGFREVLEITAAQITEAVGHLREFNEGR
jgi:hypothetical protein